MIVHAGEKCIAAFDAVDEALLTQEVEGAVNRDRRRSSAVHRQTVDQFVGAERSMARQERLQDAPPNGRQPLLASGADRFGMGDRITGAAIMIMTGLGKHRLRT